MQCACTILGKAFDAKDKDKDKEKELLTVSKQIGCVCGVRHRPGLFVCRGTGSPTCCKPPCPHLEGVSLSNPPESLERKATQGYGGGTV